MNTTCLSFSFPAEPDSKATAAASSQLQGGRVGALLCRAGVPSVPSCRSPPPQPPRAAEQVVGRPRAGALKAAPSVNARVKGTIFSAGTVPCITAAAEERRENGEPSPTAKERRGKFLAVPAANGSLAVKVSGDGPKNMGDFSLSLSSSNVFSVRGTGALWAHDSVLSSDRNEQDGTGRHFSSTERVKIFSYILAVNRALR